MKSFPTSRKGPFKSQIYYTPQEIENICTEALRSVDLYPPEPGPIRIDRFIEKKFATCIIYENLPSEILGYTIFGKNGVQNVVIANCFDEEGTQSAERRLRTTIAHEAGHCLLHTHLFCMNENSARPLFADYTDQDKPKILCRDDKSVKNQYDGNWWEFQADMTIGGLLIPRSLLIKALHDILEPSGKLGSKILPAKKRLEATTMCAKIFDVNPIVARIRIDEIWPENNSRQLLL